MDFEMWLKIGRDNDYFRNAGCWTHGWQPETDDDAMTNGFDQCIHVIQLDQDTTCGS